MLPEVLFQGVNAAASLALERFSRPPRSTAPASLRGEARDHLRPSDSQCGQRQQDMVAACCRRYAAWHGCRDPAGAPGAPAREPLPVHDRPLRRPGSTRAGLLILPRRPHLMEQRAGSKASLAARLWGVSLRRRPARLCLLGRVRFAAQTMSSADGLLTSCANAGRPQIRLRATRRRCGPRGDDRLSSGVKHGS